MARVVALPAFQRAKTVCCYLSMPTAEVQTAALVSTILADTGTGHFSRPCGVSATVKGRKTIVRAKSNVQGRANGLCEGVR